MAEMPQSKILRNRSSTPVVEFHEYVENQSRFPLIITRHKQILPTFVPSEQRREKPKKKKKTWTKSIFHTILYQLGKRIYRLPNTHRWHKHNAITHKNVGTFYKNKLATIKFTLRQHLTMPPHPPSRSSSHIYSFMLLKTHISLSFPLKIISNFTASTAAEIWPRNIAAKKRQNSLERKKKIELEKTEPLQRQPPPRRR